VAIFERTEYLDRINAVKQRMETAGIDLLLVSEPTNMAYLSGYACITYYFRGFVVIAPEDEEPLWIGREWTDAPAARLTTFLDDDRIIGYPESRFFDPECDVETFIAGVLADRGWQRRRIGMELESRQLPYAAVQRLLRRLPEATVVSADELVDHVRMVKSPAEIALTRQAGVIADRAMELGVASIDEGVRQCDTAAVIYQALIAGTPDYGGQIPDTLEFTVGERGPALRSLWTDEPFRQGELASIEIFGSRHAYSVGLTRSVAIGRPSDFVVDMMTVVAAAMEETFDQARPGATYGALADVFHAAVGRHGHQARPMVGYTIGACYLAMDEIRPALLRPGDAALLEPNHVLHLIPIMRMEHGDWGFSMSQTFRVTDSGPPELLTTTPLELIVKS
jgi:Xaa-Pro aminopeptidase